MSNKNVWVVSFLFGVLAGYALSLYRMLSMQEKLTELSKPPRKFTRDDWWENNQPDTQDEYELILAKRNWFRNFLVNYVYPYIDQNAGSVLIEEFLSPLNEKLVKMEMKQEAKERASKLLYQQKIVMGQTDD